MTLHLLYKDFVRFLKAPDRDEDAWDSYQRYYLGPHREFLFAYWQHFRWMDLDQIAQRVNRVKRGDYFALEVPSGGRPPEQIARQTLDRCREVVPAPAEPEVYLFVGFFSADAFVMELRDKPVIGVGLERFKDFGALDIILAHEYCHWLRRQRFGNNPPTLGSKLLSEGLAIAFSQLALPGRALHQYLFLSQDRLNWCRENFPALSELAQSDPGSTRLISLFFNEGENEIPPRTGNYVGYRLVSEYLARQRNDSIERLIGLGNIGDLTE